jgi:hypothetical protein
VMPDDGLTCANISNGERRQCAADNTQQLCEEAGCCWNASVHLPPYGFGCWLKNRAGTSVGHPLPALMTFRAEGCFTCVSMMGKTGCPSTSTSSDGQPTVCAQGGRLTVVASDAPLYLLPADGRDTV